MLNTAVLSLRPIGAGDEQFLYEVYWHTREPELALVDWTDEQKHAFVQMQFVAQHEYYQQHYTDTSWDLIMVDDVPAGRLYVARWSKEIRIVDIALIPAFRNRGIGTTLLQSLQHEATEARKPLSIHVEQFNPAQYLYERLGFQRTVEKGVYWLMEWTPATA